MGECFISGPPAIRAGATPLAIADIVCSTKAFYQLLVAFRFNYFDQRRTRFFSHAFPRLAASALIALDALQSLIALGSAMEDDEW